MDRIEATDVTGELPIVQELMKEALILLDRSEAPGEIGAYLDLALCKLQDFMAGLQMPLAS